MRSTPWTQSDCPRAISELRPELRSLALGYANALLAAGRSEERALSLGVARAFATDEVELGPDAGAMYVQATDDQWVIFSDASEDTYAFYGHDDAVRRGVELAHAQGVPLVVLASDGTILETREVAGTPHSEHAFHVQRSVAGWVVRGPNGQAAFPGKREAVAAARVAARSAGADVVVHHRDGSIADYESVA